MGSGGKWRLWRRLPQILGVPNHPAPLGAPEDAQGLRPGTAKCGILSMLQGRQQLKPIQVLLAGVLARRVAARVLAPAPGKQTLEHVAVALAARHLLLRVLLRLLPRLLLLRVPNRPRSSA